MKQWYRPVMRGVALGLLGMSWQLFSASATESNVMTNQDWHASLAGGVQLNSGNSDTKLYNASLSAERMGTIHELRLGADTAYGTDKGAANVDNSKGNAHYNYHFSKLWYALADLSANRDSIADLQYRCIGSPGLGYYLVKESDISLGIEAGPAYLRERKGGVEDQKITFRFAERGEWHLLKTSKIWEGVEYLPKANDFEQYLINAEAGAEAALTTLLNIRLIIKEAYDNNPAPGAQSNDVSITGALSVKI